jgi:protocatechuate 3,4-dioxygenase beta subunit
LTTKTDEDNLEKRAMHTALLLLLASGLTGRVTGVNLSPIPAAVVTILQPDSGWKRLVLTNARGEYSIAQLPPGRYEVEAVKPGLKVAASTVTIHPGESPDVNLRMTADRDTLTIRVDHCRGFSY